MRKQLEFQSDSIEAVLSTHAISARVTGGTVTPRWIRFHVLPAVGAKLSRIVALREELAAALDVPNCRVSRRGAAVSIEVPRADPHPVRLLPLYRQLRDKDGASPPMTAVLGLAEDGAPLLIRLPSPDVAHILVAGSTGSGKTALLQTVALSLAMANPAAFPSQHEARPGSLALMMIDLSGTAFESFAGLPHLTRPLIRDAREATEALGSLVHLMEKRGSVGGPGIGGRPPVVVVIDELANLLVVGGEATQQALTRLTQRGREAGIHIIAATPQPSTAVLNSSATPHFPVRLVGRVESVEDARVATGCSGTGAERLTGRGDFVAVAEGRVTRFQTACVSPEEIRETVAHLARSEALPSPVSVAYSEPATLASSDRLAEVGRGAR
jgi:S-DNA-T family DNA segregation ATPase FtsK/SpoIIIE